MEPRIVILPEKRLIGKHLRMSLSDNRTVELWRSFMSSRKEIKNALSPDLFSMQVYDASFNFKDFNVNAPFEKWAAAEVKDYSIIPENMEAYTLKGGLYAVFIYKGLPSDFHNTFQYIFTNWLPNSEFEVDQREHFELLGEKYKNNDPSSEEEIWVPIKKKTNSTT